MNPLSKMNNEDLESSLQFHIANERKTLHIILDHIREVAKRELYLAQGFSDVKRYLMSKYSYSEPAARRRVDAANILKEVPTLAEKIEEGSICLSVIGELNRAIKEKENTSREKISAAQKTELVAMISGKSVAESQHRLAQVLDIQIRDYEHQRVQKDESVRWELTVPKELDLLLKQCRDLAAHQLQQEHKNHTLVSVIDVLANFYIQHKTHTSVKTRNSDNATTRKTAIPNQSLQQIDSADRLELIPKEDPQSQKTNKTLTSKTRREILARDKCCQFKDPKTGKVCGSTFIPQIDHKTSQWVGGNHEPKNLQVLCANHNRYKYRKEAQMRWC